MNTAVKRGIWVVLLLACLAVVWIAVRGQLAVGEAPVTAAPSVAHASPVSAPSTSSARPTRSATPSGSPSEPGEDPAWSAGSTETADAPEAAESDDVSATEADVTEHMTGAAAPWEEIAAAPAHLEVYREGERIVGAETAYTQQNEKGELNPQPQTVGWYGPPEWGTTPGERSGYAGIFAGHVSHSGLKDVFWRLDEVREGDLMVLTYDDGTQAAFRADMDVQSISKDGLTHDDAYGWVWALPEEGNRISLITCDLDSGIGGDGHSVNNWVVQATRVA